jgi:hypothetical protein
MSINKRLPRHSEQEVYPNNNKKAMNEDDILEHALNNGIASATEKYSVSKDIVIGIVDRFKTDISDTSEKDIPCACEGNPNTMCFQCNKQKVRRIDYDEKPYLPLTYGEKRV